MTLFDNVVRQQQVPGWDPRSKEAPVFSERRELTPSRNLHLLIPTMTGFGRAVTSDRQRSAVRHRA